MKFRPAMMIVLSLAAWPVMGQAESAEPPPFGGGGMPPPPSVREMLYVGRLLDSLPKAEREKLDALREKDPEAFGKKMMELAGPRQGLLKDSKQEKQLRELSNRYHAENDPGKRLALEKAIRAKTTAIFDQRVSEDKRRLEHMEAKLEELRGLQRKRSANRDVIIEGKVKELLSSPDARW